MFCLSFFYTHSWTNSTVAVDMSATRLIWHICDGFFLHLRPVTQDELMNSPMSSSSYMTNNINHYPDITWLSQHIKSLAFHCWLNCLSEKSPTLSISVPLSLSSGWAHKVTAIQKVFPSQTMTSSCTYIEGILPKGPYLPCVSMAGRALLAGYPRIMDTDNSWKYYQYATIQCWHQIELVGRYF